MKPQLIAALCVATAAATAADYTATSCRLRVVEGSWADMSGFTHHLNVSHSSHPFGSPGAKVQLDLAKYINTGSGWTLQDYWDVMYCPNDFQIGWSAGDIYGGHQIGYIVRVRFNNGDTGYAPTVSGNTMFSLSIQPNGDQYYWHETPVAPPPVGVVWCDYKISVYGQWMASATIVNYGYGGWYWGVPDLSSSTPPPGYFN